MWSCWRADAYLDDDGNLLAEPYRVTLVSAPAVNRAAIAK
jgi:hypothetical protein